MKKNLIVLVLLSVSSCLTAEQSIIPGAVDLNFGGNGTGSNTIDVSGLDSVARGIVLDPLGRITITGNVGSLLTVARFNGDGTINLPFGGNGTGFNSLFIDGTSIVMRGIVLDDQRRIIVSGSRGPIVTGDILVARFNSDGTVDTTFGGNNTGFNTLNVSANEDIALDVVLDDQGRIVVAGESNLIGPTADLVVARFNSDGTVDTTFGGNNTGFNAVTIGTNSRALGVILDSLGRITVSGSSGPVATADVLVGRFDSDGTVDTTFGGNNTGFNTLMVSAGQDNANRLVLDSANRIVIAGFGGVGAPILVARFDSNGILDTSFGENGGFSLLAIGGFPSQAQGLALDSQRRIVIAGRGATPTPVFNIVVARFSQNGILDTSFGVSGPGFSFLGSATSSEAQAMALDAQGGIVCAGLLEVAGEDEWAVARFFGEQFAACTLAIREKYCFLP